MEAVCGLESEGFLAIHPSLFMYLPFRLFVISFIYSATFDPSESWQLLWCRRSQTWNSLSYLAGGFFGGNGEPPLTYKRN